MPATHSYSPTQLAVVFGRRTTEMINDGRDPFTAARLAFSFASRVVARHVNGRHVPRQAPRSSPSSPFR